MPDTPRTKSEMLAAFGAARNGKTSNQDMRDMVVSGAGLTANDGFSLYAFNQSIPLTSGAQWAMSVDVADYTGYDPDPDASTVYITDPLGLATTSSDDPEPYYGYVGGKYLRNLPQGSVWCCQASFYIQNGTFVDTDELICNSSYMLPNYAQPVNYLDDTGAGIWGAPTYAYSSYHWGNWGNSAATGGGGRLFLTGVMTWPMYVTDSFVGPWNLSTPTVLQVSGETQTLQTAELDLWRIG